MNDWTLDFNRTGWAKALLAPCPREAFPSIELLRVGAADQVGASIELSLPPSPTRRRCVFVRVRVPESTVL